MFFGNRVFFFLWVFFMGKICDDVGMRSERLFVLSFRRWYCDYFGYGRNLEKESLGVVMFG